MGFLRRIFGGSHDGGHDASAGDDRNAQPVDPDADERQHELDVLRTEEARLSDLTRRQLKYADYSWQPPDQGSERRADDVEGSARP